MGHGAIEKPETVKIEHDVTNQQAESNKVNGAGQIKPPIQSHLVSLRKAIIAIKDGKSAPEYQIEYSDSKDVVTRETRGKLKEMMLRV